MTSTILIVDDELGGRAVLEAILAGQGYRLELAVDGAEAIEVADRLLPDLILLDVMMPGLDGIEVCRRIRSLPHLAEVPIIILTALDDHATLLQGLEAGADDFLNKPVDRQELRARVRTILRLNRYRTLHQQRESLREMAERVVTAQELERQRISRELHDDLGQALTAHMLSLHNLQGDLPVSAEGLHTRLGELIAETNETMDRMRLLAQALRPPLLDTLGLTNALESYCYEFSYRTHIPVSTEIDPAIAAVSELYAITLYRILQEALTNILKHAQARHAWVELSQEEEDISLTIQDDGKGFSPEAVAGGIGIAGIRERLALVGGQLYIHSTPGGGTILAAHLPASSSLAEKEIV